MKKAKAICVAFLATPNAVFSQQTSSYRFSCPTPGTSPISTTIPSISIQSAISSPGYISIDTTSSNGNLCILSLQDNSGDVTVNLPVARSYDGLDWETTAGFLSDSLPNPVCSSSICNFIGLPAPPSDEKTYVLTSYFHNGFGSKPDAARFLEQATFGPTRKTIDELDAIGVDKYKAWVQNQIENVPMSSHREYFRRHLNPRQEYPYYSAVPGPQSACDSKSHWRMFALSERDGIRSSQTNTAKYLSIMYKNGRYVWYVEGMARTTTSQLPHLVDENNEVIEQLELYPQLYFLHFREPEKKMCIGCPFLVIKKSGGAGYILNPKVDLTGIASDSNIVPRTIVNLPSVLGSGTAMVPVNQQEFTTSAIFSRYHKADDEFYLQDASSVDPSQCANHPNVHNAGYDTPTELSNTHIAQDKHPATVFPPIFGKSMNEKSGQYEYLLFDPKMNLLDNTIDNPITDGGGYLEYATKGTYNCANSPRSFLNEDGCKLSFSEYACTEGSDALLTAKQNPDKKGVVVCGSVGEIQNDLTLGAANSYDLKTTSSKAFNVDIYLFGTFTDYKNTVWANNALFDDGQLRQRMAWALYQIIPIGVPDTTAGPGAEVWLQYYDVFVRHAFGNYKNILKEISYSDVMSRWLSFYNNMSLQYNIDNCDLDVNTIEQCENIHPDENYAREIMQLFSIGLWQLNMDGTKKLDDNNEPLHAYDSSDIMNMARAWTGFSRAYRHRGNAESGKWGPHVDIMHLERLYRDIYPKADLLEGYIGDRYPLCADLPVQDHLKKGAIYRALGGRSNPEMHAMEWWTWEDNEYIPRLVIETSSPLYEKLCADNGSGSCTWPGKVVLENDLIYNSDATFDEYKVDTIRTLRIVLPDQKFLHYEYIRPACVDQAFLGNNAKKIIRGNIGSDLMTDESLCADPKREMATELCCAPGWETSAGDQYASRHCIYQGERMSFHFASNRCAEFGEVPCHPRRYGPTNGCSIDVNRRLWYSWTTSSCMTRAKINFDSGLVGRVDYPGPDFAGQRLVSKVVDENTKNFFKAAWVSTPNLPSTANECDSLSNCYSVSDGCICDTSLSETAVFGSSNDISSKDDLFPALHVGTFDPVLFDAGVIFALGKCGFSDVDFYSRSSSDTCTSLSTESFFAFTDHHGIKRYLKNMRSTVTILGVNASFRNAPYFISLTDQDRRDMYYETDAVIEHFFHHPSHAPFLATRIIQRFGVSNPSPGYIKRVATAYTNGKYDGIGSGSYGDLGAMIAAVLLDTESRSTTLDADPSHGHLREPLIKVTSFLRSMEATYDSPSSWPKFHRLSSIGQSPYGSPSVFSFFLPDYAPAGIIEKSKLVAPESQVLTGKGVTTLLNGLFSTVKFGLVSCYNGFGANVGGCPTTEGNTDSAAGYLDYSFPTGATVDEALDDLALLLTGGRLSFTNRDIIRNTIVDEYNNGDKAKATRVAQQLVLSSPEFHSWGGLHDNTGTPRQIEGYTSAPKSSYKSVVFFHMGGGVDSFNMIVPKSGCSKNMYLEYTKARGKLALPLNNLLDIDATGSGQLCNTWGIHQNFPILKELYDQGDATFFMNTGILSEPLTKGDDWVTKSKIRLFAHNHMTREALALDPHDANPGTGVGGRLLDMLKKNGFQTSGNTIDGSSLLNVGDSYYSNAATTVSAGGIDKIDEISSLSGTQMIDLAKKINGDSNPGNSMLGETWSDRLSRSLFEYETALSIEQAIANGDFDMDGYPASDRVGLQFKAAAQFMKSRHMRKVDREVYVVGQGGYDMHGSLFDLPARFSEANGALKNFIAELKRQGTWEDTVILMGSDFGRSVAPNSNGGSDHGWGGNYFMLGGGLKGGKIMGEYPEHLSETSPYWVRRGRMIPTTPLDSVWNGIAEWMGVKGDRDLSFVLPNRVNFDKCSKMFTAHDLFLNQQQYPCIDDIDGDGVEDSRDLCDDTMYWKNDPVDSSGCTEGAHTASPTRSPVSSTAAPVATTTGTPTRSPVATTGAPIRTATGTPTRSPVATTGAPTASPGIGEAWFIEAGTVSVDAEKANPQIKIKHNVSPGAGGMELTLYQNDCVSTVDSGDSVYIVDSLTNVGSGLAEYVVEIDKENIGGSEVLVGTDTLNFCIVAGLKETEGGEILVSRLSRLKLTFDLSYALFFTEVTGGTPDDLDAGDVVLFFVNACICSVSFTCDAQPPLMMENTLISVCIWPSSSGVKFVDFTMEISGKTNGFSYSPITVENGVQAPDPLTVLQQRENMWMVTTKLLPGLFEGESSIAVIKGGGYLEFANSKNERVTSAKEYSLAVALEEQVENPSGFGCRLRSILGKVLDINS